MLFLMRSPTCSGKTLFIERHFDNKNSIFSSDDFRERMTGSKEVQQFNKNVFETMHNIIDFRLANRVNWTVYDATNLRMKDATPIINICKKHHTPFTILSLAPPSVEELKERNKERYSETGFFVPESVIETHHRRYEDCKKPFLEEALYNDLCAFIEIDQNYGVIREVK